MRDAWNLLWYYLKFFFGALVHAVMTFLLFLFLRGWLGHGNIIRRPIALLALVHGVLRLLAIAGVVASGPAIPSGLIFLATIPI